MDLIKTIEPLYLVLLRKSFLLSFILKTFFIALFKLYLSFQISLNKTIYYI